MGQPEACRIVTVQKGTQNLLLVAAETRGYLRFCANGLSSATQGDPPPALQQSCPALGSLQGLVGSWQGAFALFLCFPVT